MLGIRARGLASRRLERLEKGEQLFVEAVNYGLPVMILTVVGVVLRWRRRQIAPLTSPNGRDLSVGSVSPREVGS